jgi:hypothetical protein
MKRNLNDEEGGSKGRQVSLASWHADICAHRRCAIPFVVENLPAPWKDARIVTSMSSTMCRLPFMQGLMVSRSMAVAVADASFCLTEANDAMASSNPTLTVLVGVCDPKW